MNIILVLDFICIGFADLWGTRSERKFKNICIFQESNPQPFVPLTCGFDRLASTTDDNMCLKVVHIFMSCKLVQHVATPPPKKKKKKKKLIYSLVKGVIDIHWLIGETCSTLQYCINWWFLEWVSIFTLQSTIFQLYMWRHLDVQADWRRSWTYGRTPNAVDIL